MSSIIIIAQPDRYWSESFNTEASMLAGSVVGGNSDITSIYFNPAGISEIESKKIVQHTYLFIYPLFLGVLSLLFFVILRNRKGV